jgi:two-component system, response regulator PdtaR
MRVACVEADALAERILLPQRGGPSNPNIVPEVQPDARAGTARRRVLVVDDEWLISAQIEQILTTAGFEIVGTAYDAASAIALADRERPDLVLMDIRLQGAVDGIDAAREIADRFGIRSLFVSAHTDQGTIARTLAARPVGWLPKPFT